MHRPEGWIVHVTPAHSFPLLNTDVDQFQRYRTQNLARETCLNTHLKVRSIACLKVDGQPGKMSERKQVAFATQEAILGAILIRARHRVSLHLNMKSSE